MTNIIPFPLEKRAMDRLEDETHVFTYHVALNKNTNQISGVVHVTPEGWEDCRDAVLDMALRFVREKIYGKGANDVIPR